MATVLYTPEILGLATSLAKFSWDEGLPLKGEGRSRSCGSTIALALSLDAGSRVAQIALKSHACAIGQAAAAIFACAAKGRSLEEIDRSATQIESWLVGEGETPDWPGISVLEAALDYPARHGAILLAWQAARQLLPSG
ncbi:MAG: iron-sulfur cluster assembly scaffold protein [Novosphingobium sp.]|nr:iron-sulfur cluster assembly scaffold protein [Novosphingobium sp.]